MDKKSYGKLKQLASEWAGLSAIAAASKASGDRWDSVKRKTSSRDAAKEKFLAELEVHMTGQSGQN